MQRRELLLGQFLSTMADMYPPPVEFEDFLGLIENTTGYPKRPEETVEFVLGRLNITSIIRKETNSGVHHLYTVHVRAASPEGNDLKIVPTRKS